RHAPVLINRVLSTAQFWDGRAASLETQVSAPVSPLINSNEMNSTPDEVLAVLTANYAAEFTTAYNAAPSVALMGQAIAAYERTILTGGSPADQYEAGT